MLDGVNSEISSACCQVHSCRKRMPLQCQISKYCSKAKLILYSALSLLSAWLPLIWLPGKEWTEWAQKEPATKTTRWVKQSSQASLWTKEPFRAARLWSELPWSSLSLFAGSFRTYVRIKILTWDYFTPNHIFMPRQATCRNQWIVIYSVNQINTSWNVWFN